MNKEAAKEATVIALCLMAFFAGIALFVLALFWTWGSWGFAIAMLVLVFGWLWLWIYSDLTKKPGGMWSD